MTFTFPFFGCLEWKSILRPPNENDQSSVQKSALESGEQRVRTRVLYEKIMRENPEALQSEIGAMAVMSQYPRNY